MFISSEFYTQRNSLRNNENINTYQMKENQELSPTIKQCTRQEGG
jgi:hypothetical protein